MGKTIAQKIIAAHLLSGDMTPGSEVALRIDQTLTQDATGTMAYLALEGMDDRVDIEWNDISLQDITQEAQAELYKAQAEKLRAGS